MRQSVREYARANEISDRVVRLKLAKGKLPGGKQLNAVTGLEEWYVELDPVGDPNPDPTISDGHLTSANGPHGTADPVSVGSDPTSDPTRDPTEDGTEKAVPDPTGSDLEGAVVSWLKEHVERLHRENLELAGRLGWMTKELETTRLQLTEAHQTIALLEAPKVSVAPAATLAPKPWWKFW